MNGQQAIKLSIKIVKEVVWVLAMALAMSAKVMGLIVVVTITIMAFLAHFVPKD
jgi:hypothetical protein